MSKVSVCMATYNGQKYIKEQLISILSQLSVNDEIIISDDGSKDKTLKIIKSLNDSRIKVYRHKMNVEKSKNYHLLKKVTRNFENAINKASGDIIFLSDQDDVWKPNKIHVMSEKLKEYDCVISGFTEVDENLIEIGDSKKYLRILHSNYLKQYLNCPYFGCVMAMNRKFVEFSLPLPNIAVHDRYLGLLAKRVNQLGVVDEELIYYRRHGANNSAKTNNSFLSKFIFRFKLLIFTLTRGNYK